jgi:hypothetical protein
MRFAMNIKVVATGIVALAVMLMLNGATELQASSESTDVGATMTSDRLSQRSTGSKDAEALGRISSGSAAEGFELANAQTTDPDSVIRAWAAAASAEDLPAALALFAEGSVGEGNACLVFGETSCDLAAGWSGLVAAVGDVSPVSFTVVESTTTEATVSGVFESRFALMDELAGEPTRNRQLFDADVVDGLITRLGWVSDLDDPITARNEALFFEFSQNLSAPEALPSSGMAGLADPTGGSGPISALKVAVIATATVVLASAALRRRRSVAR